MAESVSIENTTLENLAMQARAFVQNACMNLLQLGRVLCEAKPLVPYGEWDTWIKENAKMSRRTAEQYMQAYTEFGLNSQIAELGTTKVLKLLPMPAQERERLLSENDVASMSTRQLDEAIRQQKANLIKEARAEVQGEIEREREARIAAEKRAKEAEGREPKVSPGMLEKLNSAEERAKSQQAEIERLSRIEKENKAEKEQLMQEIRVRDEMLEEQQADYDTAQEELLSLKSAIAKGDAERTPSDQLTPDAFASAVRAFIGACARMPHMGTAFSSMSLSQKNEYDELLRTVESWATGSRKALDAVMIEGMVIE